MAAASLGVMKCVVDTNQLQSQTLRVFLSASPGNIAVLPDFVAMEAYKGDPLKSIFKSMRVLSDFPRQVLILKGSRKICALTGRRKGLQRRLIDENQTQNFPEYIRALRLAESGNARLQTEILEYGRFANEHLDRMRDEAENIRSAIEVLSGKYTKEERATLRKREEYTPDLVDKLVRTVMEMTAMIFRDSPLVRRRSTYQELPNTFIFRVTFAVYLLGMRRFAHGGLEDLSAEKLRNDFVDMMLVAYGTYFDGLLSEDKNVNYMYQECSLLLTTLLDAEVPFHSALQR